MSDENELLFDKLYEQTQECGRTQFIRLLMDKERHIKQLESQLQEKEKIKKEAIEYIDKHWPYWATHVCEYNTELKEILERK